MPVWACVVLGAPKLSAVLGPPTAGVKYCPSANAVAAVVTSFMEINVPEFRLLQAPSASASMMLELLDPAPARISTRRRNVGQRATRGASVSAQREAAVGIGRYRGAQFGCCCAITAASHRPQLNRRTRDRLSAAMHLSLQSSSEDRRIISRPQNWLVEHPVTRADTQQSNAATPTLTGVVKPRHRFINGNS